MEAQAGGVPAAARPGPPGSPPQNRQPRSRRRQSLSPCLGRSRLHLGLADQAAALRQACHAALRWAWTPLQQALQHGGDEQPQAGHADTWQTQSPDSAGSGRAERVCSHAAATSACAGCMQGDCQAREGHADRTAGCAHLGKLPRRYWPQSQAASRRRSLPHCPGRCPARPAAGQRRRPARARSACCQSPRVPSLQAHGAAPRRPLRPPRDAARTARRHLCRSSAPLVLAQVAGTAAEAEHGRPLDKAVEHAGRCCWPSGSRQN